MRGVSNNMKRILSMLSLFLLAILVVGCNSKTSITTIKTSTKDSTSTKNVITTKERTTNLITTNLITTTKEESKFTVKENNYIIEASNGKLDIILSKNNGSLSQFKNLENGVDYIENSDGANWHMLIDTTTSNPFKTKLSGNGIMELSSRDYKPLISYKAEDNLVITLIYEIEFEVNNDTYLGVCVTETLTIEEDSKVMDVDIKIENLLRIDSCIVNLTGLILSGVRDKNNDLSLLYPILDGISYSNPVTRAYQGSLKQSRTYPQELSLQLVELCNDQEALYYICEDSTKEYKQFNFGDFTNSYDKDLEIKEDKVSMSITQYPFISRNNTKSLHTMKIGVSTNDSWYEGADIYRDFLIDSGRVREQNNYSKYWNGTIVTTVAHTGDNQVSTYTGDNNPAMMVKSSDQYGVDTVTIIGWHKGGFDTLYPDYDFYEGENYNGAEGFKEMVNLAHESNDKVIPYFNIHIADSKSNWGKANYNETLTNIEHGAVKKAGWSEATIKTNLNNYTYNEIWGDGSPFYVMCPSSDNFQNQILSRVGALIDCGVDGIWFDQLMTSEARLCYDESHGHSNPAAAYAGFDGFLAKVHQLFKDKGKDEYFIFCEGVTDAYEEWVDVCGRIWTCKLHKNANCPEFTAYTMPSKFLGTGSDTSYTHAWAFILGCQLIDSNNYRDYQVTKLYADYPEIYMNGRYMATRGLEVTGDNILSSILLSEDGDVLAVQLYNNSDTTITVRVKVDESRYGNLSNPINLFNNTSLTLSDGYVEITLEAGQLASIKYNIS